MTKKMLKFIDLKQETPEKRGTEKRKGDFNEIYKNTLLTKPLSSLVDALSVECLFVRFIVH